VVVEVQAPEPAVPELFGDAQWMRVFVTQLPFEATLDELMADNPAIVPMDPRSWRRLLDPQDEPLGGNAAAPHQNRGNLLPTTRTVVRRIELWEFTGSYDPLTRGALRRPDLQHAGGGRDRAADQHPDDRGAGAVRLGHGDRPNGLVGSADKRISCGTVRRALRRRRRGHAHGQGRQRQRLLRLDWRLRR
jgi:hypothetical protein